MSLPRALSCAAVLSALLAACGGGGGGSGGGASATSVAPPGTGTTTTTAPTASGTFAITPVAGFSIAGSVPNAAVIDGKVTLIYSLGQQGLCEAESTDGVTFTNTGVASQRFRSLLAPVGANAADVIVRGTSGGKRRYFMKALSPSQTAPRALYMAEETTPGGPLTLRTTPVYTGGPSDGGRVEVPDIIVAPGGGWRLFYVAMLASRENARTALSNDEGLTFGFESDNPFGDLTTTGQTHVDPCPFRRNDGSYMAITMRGARLFLWTSPDGLRFTEVPGVTVSASQFPTAPAGADGLFDPTLVQLPSGRLLLYTACGSVGSGTGTAIVAAEVTVR